MIVREKHLVFVHIQKTGGNSICRALGQNPNCPEKHYTALELAEYYGQDIWDQCYKFSFVRNPWDRLVSWYSMIDSNRERYRAGAPLNAFQRFILDRATCFSEFLTNCDQEIRDPDGRKWVFRNQLDYLVDDHGQLRVDFIGRFESIEQDFTSICQSIFGEPISLPHENRSVHPHYSNFYTQKLVDIVARRYAADINAFGYDFSAKEPS